MPSLIELIPKIKQENTNPKEDLKNRAQISHLELITTHQQLIADHSELLLAPRGTKLQKAIQIIQLATIYGQSAARYFEKGENVSLTGISHLSLTNAHFEFGRRIARTQAGELEERLGLWHIHSDNAKEINPQSFTEMVENFSVPTATDNLVNLTPNQVFIVISRHLDLASR